MREVGGKKKKEKKRGGVEGYSVLEGRMDGGGISWDSVSRGGLVQCAPPNFLVCATAHQRRAASSLTAVLMRAAWESLLPRGCVA